MNQQVIENWCRSNIDKVLHFIIGLTISQLAYLWIWFLFLPLVIGLVKEIFDNYSRKTGFNWLDLAATITGCVPVIAVWLINKFML